MKKKSSINLCDYRGTYDSLERMLKKYKLYCEYLDLFYVIQQNIIKKKLIFSKHKD